MREIKFRAKATVTREWLYSNGYYFDGINYWFVLPDASNKALAWSHSHTIDIETLGEYTGLKDKNGKEIYEGDIVEFPVGSGDLVTQEVTFNRGAFITKSGRMWGFEKDTGYLGWYEAIGNIYENPELLKGGKNGNKS